MLFKCKRVHRTRARVNIKIDVLRRFFIYLDPFYEGRTYQNLRTIHLRTNKIYYLNVLNYIIIYYLKSYYTMDIARRRLY